MSKHVTTLPENVKIGVLQHCTLPWPCCGRPTILQWDPSKAQEAWQRRCPWDGEWWVFVRETEIDTPQRREDGFYVIRQADWDATDEAHGG